MTASRIAGLGHAVPALRVTNDTLETELGLEPGWIERRTGIRARRICAPDESCSTLAVAAARAALEHAGIDATEIGLVLLATSTPDHLLPPTAPAVAHALGCAGAGAIDLAGACAGFVYALALADGQVRVTGRPALVVAANVLSRRVDPADPGARGIFADGAGAAVLAHPSTAIDSFGTVLGIHLGSDGALADAIRIRAGGSVRPIDLDAVREGLHFLRIERGSSIFVEAVQGMAEAGRGVLDAAGLRSSDVDLWVPHQANLRILERAGEKLGIDRSRWMLTLDEWGNSSAASIPTALSIASESGRMLPGSKVLLTAVGAGLVTAAALVEGPAPGQAPTHRGER